MKKEFFRNCHIVYLEGVRRYPDILTLDWIDLRLSANMNHINMPKVQQIINLYDPYLSLININAFLLSGLFLRMIFSPVLGHRRRYPDNFYFHLNTVLFSPKNVFFITKNKRCIISITRAKIMNKHKKFRKYGLWNT